MRLLIFVLFFLSGITGLVYEVVWAKFLGNIIGNTAHAHAIVLSTFLGGLAIGNALLGRLADRTRNQFLLYGRLEIGIGVLAGASPFLLERVADLYLGLVARGVLPPTVWVKLLVCGVAILPPTVLMGGTLPALCRYITRSMGELNNSISTLYFLNSGGAVLGALLPVFYLIPLYGLNLTITIAAILNIGIGLVSMIAGYYQVESDVAVTREQPAKLTPLQVILIGGAFFSGLASLLYETAWIRLLTLTLGSSVHSFAIMLAAFIAGIALGSLVVKHFVREHTNALMLFALAELGIVVAMGLVLPLYEQLPYYFVVLRGLIRANQHAFLLFEGSKFLFAFVAMLLPAMFIGMTLPLATKGITEQLGVVGKRVGQIFSFNTFGNVLGAILGGLWLLPEIGIWGLIYLASFINYMIGAVVIYAIPQLRIGTRLVSLALPILLLGGFSLYTGSNLLTGGIRGDQLLSGGGYRAVLSDEIPGYDEYLRRFQAQRVLYHKDDSNGTVSIVQYPDKKLALKINGKPDASTGKDMATQVLLGHLPLFLHPDAKRILIIGYGSGVTVGSVLKHPVESVEVVEISSAVVAGGNLFAEYNGEPLKDTRVQLHIEDAKSFLNIHNQKYDLIISEPTNPWIAGVASLFTVDFYQQLKKHLNPGGVIVQWVHTYEMDNPTLSLILRSFLSEFSQVSLWNSILGNNLSGDYILFGENADSKFDYRNFEHRFALDSVKMDLARIKITEPLTVLSLHVLDDYQLRALIKPGALNTDNFPVLEYSAPRGFFMQSVASLLHKADLRGEDMEHNTFYSRQLRRTLSEHEYRDIYNYHDDYGSKSFATNVAARWVSEYPDSEQAKLALVARLIKENKFVDVMTYLGPLLQKYPSNIDLLELGATVELELAAQGSESLRATRQARGKAYLTAALNLASPIRRQALLERELFSQ